jgi:dienelactone hydrolase
MSDTDKKALWKHPVVFLCIVSMVLGPLASTVPQASGPEALPCGRVLTTVACIQDPSQTYALYLPTAYTPDRSWPVIYAFDPGARGILPVERLQAAAERFGHIVIGSNVSRNFEPQQSLAAADAMWADSHTRFAIDSRRVYAMGFSGGARLASALAVLSTDFAGVIACGASFDSRNPPRDGRPALFAGIVGLMDMNYPEMRGLEKRLPAAKVPYRLFVFDGAHDWPPAELFLEVLAWLQIRAMGAGALPSDDAFREDYFQQLWRNARTAREAERWLEAGRLYGALAEDGQGWKGSNEANAERQCLLHDPAFQKAAKRDRQLLREEDEQLLRLDRRFVQIRNTPMAAAAIPPAVRDWRREFDRFRPQPGQRRPPDEVALYRRLTEFIWRRAAEEAVLFARMKEYTRTALLLEIARYGQPQDANLAFYLGKTYARLDEGDRAMRALGDAVDCGFRDCSALQDPVFDNLSRRSDFQTLLRSLADAPPRP